MINKTIPCESGDGSCPFYAVRYSDCENNCGHGSSVDYNESDGKMKEFDYLMQFKRRLRFAEDNAINAFNNMVTSLNCNLHDTVCCECPFYLANNCVLFMCQVEFHNRVKER